MDLQKKLLIIWLKAVKYVKNIDYILQENLTKNHFVK